MRRGILGLAPLLLLAGTGHASSRSETALAVAQRYHGAFAPRAIKVRGGTFVPMWGTRVAYLHRDGEGMTVWPVHSNGDQLWLGKGEVKHGPIASLEDATRIANAGTPAERRAAAIGAASARRWWGRIRERYLGSFEGEKLAADAVSREPAFQRGNEVTLPAGSLVRTPVGDGEALPRTYRLKQPLTGLFAYPGGIYLPRDGQIGAVLTYTNPLVLGQARDAR